MSKSTHGGRRHGLSPAGESKPTKVRLGQSGDARLAEIAAALDLTASEVLRRLLTHPHALIHARDP